jgi:hypothetical protein
VKAKETRQALLLKVLGCRILKNDGVYKAGTSQNFFFGAIRISHLQVNLVSGDIIIHNDGFFAFGNGAFDGLAIFVIEDFLDFLHRFFEIYLVGFKDGIIVRGTVALGRSAKRNKGQKGY